MTEIIDGKKIARKIEHSCKETITKLAAKGIIPKLAIVVYNPEQSSRVYVNLKLKKATELGMACELYDWSNLSLEQCIAKMRELAEDSATHAIIVQLPANGLDNVDALLKEIPPNKDADGLNPAAEHQLVPATAQAILELLRYSGVELKEHKIAIVGQGKLVGKPLAQILRARSLQLETADDKTNDLRSITTQADILISAAGKPGLIVGGMIKPGAVVIDAGTSELHGALVGDVNYDSIEGKASKIAKVPGGVGPVTVISLLQNVIEASKNSR